MMSLSESSTDTRASVSSFTATVLLFSVLREKVGSREIHILLTEPCTVSELLDAVCDRYPEVRDYRDTIRVGINAEYALPDQPVREGDEVALITPVSGG